MASLGPHVGDYAEAKLKFYLNGKFITLQGDIDNKPERAQLHHLRRMHHTGSVAQMFTLQQVDTVTTEDHWSDFPKNVDPEMATLLYTCREIFQVPQGLPPYRELYHEILLQPGSQPVKVKPYRYPHSQKEQIEKMV